MDRTKTHVQCLDSIRGIAIMMVFVFHCLGVAFRRDHLPWGTWFRDFSASKSFLALFPVTFGWAGVAVFFVVSGFCIHSSFLRGAPGDWRGFYLRRFFRIYPPYLLALIVFAILFPTTRLSFHSLWDWKQMGSHLLLLHNFGGSTLFGINPSFWSIAVEAQLYLIYPVLIALVGRIGWGRALLVLGCVEFSMRGYAGFVETWKASYMPQWYSGSPLFYWYSWAIGAALAEAYVQNRALPFRSLPVSVLLLLGVGVFLVKPLALFAFPIFAVATVAIIAKILGREKALPLPKPILSHLSLLGVCSYSFYLLHQPIVGAIPYAPYKLGTSFHPLALYVWCVCGYPVILALSWFYYRYCELHSIAFGKLFLRKKPINVLPQADLTLTSNDLPSPSVEVLREK